MGSGVLKTVFVAGAAIALMAGAAESQPLAAAAPSYADLADLALAAPVAAHVRLRRAVPLKPAQAGAAAPGLTRFFIEADVLSLIRGAQGSPARVTYLADVPNAPNGKPAKLQKRSEYIVLAAAVPGREGELRLVAPDAQLAYAPERAAMLRSILQEASAASAAPAVTGVARAFHVPGSLAGESETQIFLQTAAGDPVSLTVLRRPGLVPTWAVALGDIVDDAAAEPKPNSLLWYRLACALPRALPRQSLADAAPEHVPAIHADYRLILDRLGPCVRTRR
jgi:hypothetical protein